MTSLSQEMMWEFAGIGGYGGSNLPFSTLKAGIAGLGFCVGSPGYCRWLTWVLPLWFGTQTMDQFPHRWDNDPGGDFTCVAHIGFGTKRMCQSQDRNVPTSDCPGLGKIWEKTSKGPPQEANPSGKKFPQREVEKPCLFNRHCPAQKKINNTKQ